MLPDTCLLGATEKELLHNFRANRGGEKAVVDFTENGGEKLGHGSGGMELLRAA